MGLLNKQGEKQENKGGHIFFLLVQKKNHLMS